MHTKSTNKKKIRMQLNKEMKKSSTTVPIVGVRPSSPRQFFERLYGHLENADAKTICSPGQSELSSSPDILDDR